MSLCSQPSSTCHVHYGPCALSLGPPIASPPTLDADLTGWQNALCLDRFYSIGSVESAVTPTSACIVWDDEALYVAFRCAEPNPGYRPLDHTAPAAEPSIFKDFMAPHLRPGLYADSVAVHVRPHWDTDEFFTFTLASSGKHREGRYFAAHQPGVYQAPLLVDDFTTSVMRTADGWVALIAIPWALIGGQPGSPFGLTVQRVRNQSFERLSPIGTGSEFDLEPDLCMEVTLGGETACYTSEQTFATSPSGMSRWQLPARTIWPDEAERRAIWELQQIPHEPTTPENLPRRVHLLQRWMDLLALEGINFGHDAGYWQQQTGAEDPEYTHRAFNRLLLAGDLPGACTLLDTLLAHMDAFSRNWFADETPGDFRAEAWSPIIAVERIRCDEYEVLLECSTDKFPVTLHLSCPETGGFRLHAGSPGLFEPQEYQPLACQSSITDVTIETPDLMISIEHHPLAITATARDGTAQWRISGEDIAFRFTPDGTVLAVDFAGGLASEEAIYGFGERFDTLNQRGRILTLWEMDAWSGNLYRLLNNTYKPVPLFHSTGGYAVFLNSTYRIRADIGHTRADRCRLTAHGPILDLFVWLGDPAQTLRAYTKLTGKPMLPPKWAFEPWMGGGLSRWLDGPLHDMNAEMLGVVARFAELDIPHSAIYTETRVKSEVPNDPRLFPELNRRGIRPLAWMNCVMWPEMQREFLPGLTDDELPLVPRAGGALFNYVDFTHPRAMELLRNYWRSFFDLGVAGSMVDFGDMYPEDGVAYDGRRGNVLHNRYAYEYQRAYHDVFTERLGEDYVLFGRPGAPGCQRWMCQFAGDHLPNFPGMRAALRGALNLSACGFSNWGGDIGGYFGWPDPEVYIRWVEWGCFSPIMRCHGTQPREPWEYGDAAVPIYKHYAWLRENLLDYIYSTAVKAHRTGIPIMRALPLAFPGEPSVATCDDAYLFGPDLLVAPMLQAGDRRVINFPGGDWTDLWTGETISGPITREVEAPLARIPVYLGAGALIPVRLHGSLAWGAGMSDDCVHALVLTPPATPRTVRVYQSVDEYATVIATPYAEGFTLELNGSAETRYLLLYGMPVSGVTVNGDAVEWHHDGVRVVIRLPAWERRMITIR